MVSSQFIRAGLSTIALAGAGVGIWFINWRIKQLVAYAILGFALTEAIALFGLMMAFLILFGF